MANIFFYKWLKKHNYFAGIYDVILVNDMYGWTRYYTIFPKDDIYTLYEMDVLKNKWVYVKKYPSLLNINCDIYAHSILDGILSGYSLIKIVPSENLYKELSHLFK